MAEVRKEQMLSMEKDPLTGLIGRQEFLREFNEILEQCRKNRVYDRYCLVYFNLLHFKLFNLTFGRQAGDDCLQQVAEILMHYFPKELMGRYSDDHFIVLTENNDIIPVITAIYKETNDVNLHINTGICYLDRQILSNEAAAICDQAKIACDSINNDASRYYAIYSDAIREKLERNTYIVENLEKAIRKGYIQIYFQPIIRSLTGKVCGFEALARWVDPDLGILSPTVFIPVLEDAHLVHKLDTYMLNEVGRILRRSINEGYPSIPVSMNLSRTDFVLSDPFKEMESVVKKYKLHRDLLCIEITESVLMSHKARFLEQIRKFRNAGYKVWMDDFGNGYSSLNVLRELEFDELKLDLSFIEHLDDKNRQIISTIIDMAKQLKIHTLAEGAETREQVDFLREIGCEKIQGFYYGRPQPMEELRGYLKDHDMPIETLLEARMYEKIGLVNVLTEKPTAIFQTKGEDLHMLLANPAYQAVLDSIGGRSAEEMNDILQKPKFALYTVFHDFTKKVISCKEETTLFYVDNGKDLRLTAQCLANEGDDYLIKAHLENITFRRNSNEYRSVDTIVRDIMNLYTGIFQIEYHKDRIVVLAATQEPNAVGREFYDIRSVIEKTAQYAIYPEDRKNFRKFMLQFCSDAFYEKGDISYTSGWFRFRQPDGNYKWMDHSAVLLKEEEYSALICIKEASIEHGMDQQTLAVLLSQHLQEEDGNFGRMDRAEHCPEKLLWDELMQHTMVNYFWKDLEGRFQGASKSFLSYFSLKSEEEILGKTAEELGWLTDEQATINEQRVYEKGEIIKNAVEICLARGMVRDITMTRFPIYNNGKITGLLGYFYDEELFTLYDVKMKEAETNDQLTGLLNMFGFVMSGNRLYENYRLKDKDFIMMVVDIPTLRELYLRYGVEEAQAMHKEVAHGLKRLMDQNTIMARMDATRFMIMKQTDDPEEAGRMEDAIKKYLESIRSLNGYTCTLFPYIVKGSARERNVESLDRFITFLMVDLTRMEEHQEMESKKSIWIDLDKLNELDENIYITDPETYELYYANAKSLSELGLPSNYPYHGKCCYEVLEHRTAPCDGCNMRILRKNHIVRRNYHNTLNGNDYIMRDSLISWNEGQARLTMGVNVSDFVKEVQDRDEILHKEVAANDAINIALEEIDANMGVRKMLGKIGSYMNAEKAFLYEVDTQNVFQNTYAWDKCGNHQLLPELPGEIGDILMEVFSYSVEFKVERLENIREDLPSMYAYLKSTGMDSLIAVPLKMQGHIIGYMGIANPDKKSFASAGVFLNTLTRFISILLRNRDIMHKLDVISRRDALTGVMNRRAYGEFQSTHRLHEPTAVIFADVNGLKKVNDTLGHEAGDRLIRNAANVMSALFGAESVYRLGGDEFLILERTDGPESAGVLVKRLQEMLHREKLSVAIGYVFGEGKGEEIDPLVKEADEKMYKIKEIMHREMEQQE